MPQPLLEQFREHPNHPIYDLELLPVLVAVRTGAELLKECHIVFYVDNTAAPSVLVREGSTSIASGIVQEFLKYEKNLSLLPWFGRFSPISNPADDASRLQFDTPLIAGAKDLQVVLPTHLSQWGIKTGSPEAHNRKAQPSAATNVCKQMGVQNKL